MKKLYFAYGANLNLENMALRCPDADLIGAVALYDYQLVFRGVADIVRAPGETVNGALWLITKDCEEALDFFEGYPRLYRKESISVALHDVSIPAMAYVMNMGEISPPWASYSTMIRDGYNALGLDQSLLDEAIRRANQFKQVTKELERTGS